MPYQLGSARSAANESLPCPGEQSVQPEQGSTRHKISGPPWTGKAGTAHRPAKKQTARAKGCLLNAGKYQAWSSRKVAVRPSKSASLIESRRSWSPWAAK